MINIPNHPDINAASSADACAGSAFNVPRSRYTLALIDVAQELPIKEPVDIRQ
jgi:hypothetical protein